MMLPPSVEAAVRRAEEMLAFEKIPEIEQADHDRRRLHALEVQLAELVDELRQAEASSG